MDSRTMIIVGVVGNLISGDRSSCMAILVLFQKQTNEGAARKVRPEYTERCVRTMAMPASRTASARAQKRVAKLNIKPLMTSSKLNLLMRGNTHKRASLTIHRLPCERDVLVQE